MTSNRKALVYYEICPFAVNYESVMFYSAGPNAFMIVTADGGYTNNGAIYAKMCFIILGPGACTVRLFTAVKSCLNNNKF